MRFELTPVKCETRYIFQLPIKLNDHTGIHYLHTTEAGAQFYRLKFRREEITLTVSSVVSY